jgi:histidine triad (HIT) family protein
VRLSPISSLDEVVAAVRATGGRRRRMSCLFCRIASGEIPANIVHDDESVVAFRDINPQAPTHILIIPKEHIPSLRELDASHKPLFGHMIDVANRLAESEGIADNGFRLVCNSGPDAGQSVPHLHIHLLGGRPMAWPPG